MPAVQLLAAMTLQAGGALFNTKSGCTKPGQESHAKLRHCYELRKSAASCGDSALST